MKLSELVHLDCRFTMVTLTLQNLDAGQTIFFGLDRHIIKLSSISHTFIHIHRAVFYLMRFKVQNSTGM